MMKYNEQKMYFNNVVELIDYAREHLETKDDYLLAKIKGDDKLYIVGATPLAFDDVVEYKFAEVINEILIKYFGIPFARSDDWDIVKSIANDFLDWMNKHERIQEIYVDINY